MYFDGGSLGMLTCTLSQATHQFQATFSRIAVLFVAALGMYGSVLLPGLQILAPPDEEPPFFVTLFKRTIHKREIAVGEEREMSLQILCASNTLIIGALVGIVVLQAGDWYVTKRHEKAIAEYDAKTKKSKTQ